MSFLVLLELAKPKSGLPDPARTTLLAAIQPDREEAPEVLLNRIRVRAMQLEGQFPSAAGQFWRSGAILAEAGGAFVAGVMDRFDLMSNRLTQVFSQKARLVTVILSLIVAALLPLDSISLLQQLAKDESLRASLVTQAQQLGEKLKQPQGTGDVQKDLKTLEELKKQLDSPGLSVLPEGWWPGKVKAKATDASGADYDGTAVLTSIIGVLLSAGLMSFGAPFWFDLVKNLVKLRPSGAAAEEKERQDRAAQQPAGRGSGPTLLVDRRDPEAGIFPGGGPAPAPGARG